MAAEIERKFLLAELPGWLGECRSVRIEQGYLALEKDVEVRLRAVDEAFRLTVKRGRGRSREEVEVELDGERFGELWPLTAGRRIVKRRHFRPADGGTLEIDVYEDDLAGMATAEMEFESEEAADGFTPPEWIGTEVTGDERYANRTLAVDGAPQR